MADNRVSLPLDALGVNLPYSIEAEQAVLGAMLVDSSVQDDVFAVLRPEQFYSQQNADIYREMLLLQTTGKPIDYVTVLESVTSSGVFNSDVDLILTRLAVSRNLDRSAYGSELDRVRDNVYKHTAELFRITICDIVGSRIK